MRRTGQVLLPLALLVVLPLQAAISESSPEVSLPRPSVQQQPQDVVSIVVKALANNDEPFADAGIATTFGFASPANRVNTGPLAKFAKMVRNPAYAIMIDHVEHEFSEVVRTERQAYQLVRIVGRDGNKVVFAFRLSRQVDGEFADMWMTDAVWPVASGNIPEQAF